VVSTSHLEKSGHPLASSGLKVALFFLTRGGKENPRVLARNWIVGKGPWCASTKNTVSELSSGGKKKGGGV